jgi:2-keto-3-deoxy-L-rhamnonate aldolase RhmA
MTRIGAVISLPDPLLAELIGESMDLAWIDLEHGALSVRDAQLLVLALQARGCAALVRVPSARSERVPALLDGGADGIVAPRVEHAGDAAALVERLRYPPAGQRGFGPRRAGDYGRTPAFWAAPGARVECMVQIESPAGVEAADAIAAVDGVDALVVGTADLALALGVAGDPDAAALRDAVRRVALAARRRGCAFGVAGPRGVLDAAPEIVVGGVDVRLYAEAIDGEAMRLRAAWEGTGAAA